LDRIVVIKISITEHQKNITSLRQYAHKYFNPKEIYYGPSVASYNRIPRSGTRYLETLQNLSKQVMLLEHELKVLSEWSAE
jgi:hypothetical protein